MPDRLFKNIAIAVVAAALFGCSGQRQSPQFEWMTGYEVHGIDASHYQSRIDWDSVAASGVQFAFVKATEGEAWQDSFFCQNWDAMRRAGLRRGAYHYLNPSLNARRQADNFLEMVDFEPGDLPPVVDIEQREGAPEAVMVAKLRMWLWQVERRTGRRPIIYTNLNFYNRWLAGRFDRYPLWIARFSDEKPVLARGADWLFWQYASDGQVAGVRGPLDFNVFRGPLAELEKLCWPAPVATAPTAPRTAQPTGTESPQTPPVAPPAP